MGIKRKPITKRERALMKKAFEAGRKQVTVTPKNSFLPRYQKFVYTFRSFIDQARYVPGEYHCQSVPHLGSTEKSVSVVHPFKKFKD